MKKLQKILLIITSFFSLQGCETFHPGLPAKPILTLCVIDFPSGEAICGETSFKNIASFGELNYKNVVSEILLSSGMRRVPLSQMDKGVVLLPTEWEKAENYKDELESYAKKYCQ